MEAVLGWENSTGMGGVEKIFMGMGWAWDNLFYLFSFLLVMLFSVKQSKQFFINMFGT